MENEGKKKGGRGVPFKPGHDERRNTKGAYKKKSIRLSETFDAVIKDEDWRAIVESAVNKAMGGDMKAIEWLTDRYFGKAIALNALVDSEGEDIDISERPVIIIGTPEEVKESINRLNDNIE